MAETQKKTMLRVALVGIDYPPAKTSAAVQMRDLAGEFIRQGHKPTMIIPWAEMNEPWRVETIDGVEVLRLRSKPLRDVGYVRRTINETLVSWTMWRHFKSSPLACENWDVIAWYSPPIFLAAFVKWMSGGGKALKYLILRDIFPEWAVDLKIISRNGPFYWYFKLFSVYQNRLADVIGVQTESNLGYFVRDPRLSVGRIEVLQNWQFAAADIGCSIDINKTPLKGRKIFVYIGNMGVAQGMDILVDLAEECKTRTDIGFLFVGRGSDWSRLQAEVTKRNLKNILIYQEISPAEIPGLLSQCHVGLIALHPDHKSHNIPGKFLSYMRAGLPVLAYVNAGTDLIGLVERAKVGVAFSGDALQDMHAAAHEFLDNPQYYSAMSVNAHRLADDMFSPQAAVHQILSHVVPAFRT
jgi:glycosyltransferase involved in cell wall biosynthesis